MEFSLWKSKISKGISKPFLLDTLKKSISTIQLNKWLKRQKLFNMILMFQKMVNIISLYIRKHLEDTN
jgi:hypothetical protein